MINTATLGAVVFLEKQDGVVILGLAASSAAFAPFALIARNPCSIVAAKDGRGVVTVDLMLLLMLDILIEDHQRLGHLELLLVGHVLLQRYATVLISPDGSFFT